MGGRLVETRARKWMPMAYISARSGANLGEAMRPLDAASSLGISEELLRAAALIRRSDIYSAALSQRGDIRNSHEAQAT
jgi:hypothetical protein